MKLISARIVGMKGENIEEIADELSLFVKKYDCTALLIFNNIPLSVFSNDTKTTIVKKYHERLSKPIIPYYKQKSLENQNEKTQSFKKS